MVLCRVGDYQFKLSLQLYSISITPGTKAEGEPQHREREGLKGALMRERTNRDMWRGGRRQKQREGKSRKDGRASAGNSMCNIHQRMTGKQQNSPLNCG